ncbi:MAG: biotin--[Clostridia bacterium]|nr:biotin--[acetyl-CoA-carboxylase] ligase [Clostridia bacterium]
MNINAENISALLPEKYRALHVTALGETDSTNERAKQLAAEGAELPLLITADSQTAGRGRRGRSFYSPPGCGLYMTLALPIRGALSSAVTLTTAAAAAVSRAIEELTAIRTGIKWVNDIYVSGKKVCGILAETAARRGEAQPSCVVIGVGINLSTESFPDELADTAAALGVPVSLRERLAARICAELLDIYHALPDAGYMEYYRSRSIVLGRDISFLADGRAFSGRALSVDDAGGLLVALPDGGEITLRSGEITLRLA